MRSATSTWTGSWPAGYRAGRAVRLPACRCRCHARDRPGRYRRSDAAVTTEGVAAIAVLGIVGTGFAYVLNYQIITSEGATVASTVTYLRPVVRGPGVTGAVESDLM